MFPCPNASMHPVYPAWGISALSLSFHLKLKMLTYKVTLATNGKSADFNVVEEEPWKREN